MKLEEFNEGFTFGQSAKEDLMKKVHRLANLVKERSEELNELHKILNYWYRAHYSDELMDGDAQIVANKKLKEYLESHNEGT